MSQSALARLVDLDQSTISGMIKGSQRSSTKLPAIARALNTSVEYLSGETDVAAPDVCLSPLLSDEHRALIDCYALMDSADRAAFIQIGRSLARRQSGSTLHSPGREYRGG